MKGKTKRIIKIISFSFLSLILLMLVTTICIFHGRASTMLSIKYVGSDLYTMNYQQNYHLDKALKANIENSEDLLNFICDEMFFGHKIDANFEQYGCAAFSSETPSGEKVMGRNFDLKGTDTLCVYTNPKKGYKSISTISTDMVAVGGTNSLSVKSFKGRIALLASPYMSLDGVNEKGLSAALLDMDYYETHMDTGKPDLIVTMAIRLLLDKAATVDEAVNLLKQYDIHTAHGWTQHIFISDKSGKSVIVEWYKDEMIVVDYNVCTNFWMSDPVFEGRYAKQCIRFDYLDSSLKEKNINTIEESMALLKGTKQNNTEWSIVFNKTKFEADYCVNGDYSKTYHISFKSFSNSGLVMTLIYLGIILLIDASLFIVLMIKKKKDNSIEE